ncbi:MAG TPA: aspartate carbamoyltransferase [Deltaproteobacteria bacterium]|nr:aspartate carbamoyltransferase [Deltaproteobacteria bacterium]HCP48514.1 aspartate carbamoyltransferase [Deltaproteobacteria bacterium]
MSRAADGRFRRKDLLGLRGVSAEEIGHVLDVSEQFRDINLRRVKKVPTLRGKSVVHLFLEPSTRTRTSFDIAAKRLSADTFSISGSSSSATKGETLLDTARNLAAMHPDIIVVRHGRAGAPLLLSEALPETCIVNAGDGFCEHPTQALLDMLTIRRSLGGFKNRIVTIVGDILHSRVARSAIYGLTTMGATVRICGPRTLIPVGIEGAGVEVHDRLETALKDADAVMMLRIQQERLHRGGHFFPTTREYSRLWGLDRRKLSQWARKDILVMHPGPINRGVELEPEVADGEWSVILDQVENGVAVRMAVLYLVLGGESAARQEGRA